MNGFPVVLLILDGWGVGGGKRQNAIIASRILGFPALWKKYPHATLAASGTAVGLPERQVGNSEAGHMNLGAGRVVRQDAVRINDAIREGTFFSNPVFLRASRHVRTSGGTFHIMGLLTGAESGHAFPRHLDALLQFVRQEHVHRVRLHLFTDGRDDTPFGAIRLVRQLVPKLRRERIATLIGRYWAMDRAKRWSRTRVAYDALTSVRGRRAETVAHALTRAYRGGESDEFLRPILIGSEREIVESRIRNGDAVVFFNHRSDRARQITKTFVQDRFEAHNPNSFGRRRMKRLCFVAMTDFGPDLPNLFTAFPSEMLKQTFPMQFRKRKQLYVAESEKFAHVTFFFNGGHPYSVAGEERLLIPSSDEKHVDRTPGMATQKIESAILSSVEKRQHDVIVANFANADMVGHTGDLRAGIRAVRVIDRSLLRVAAILLRCGGTLFVTADHGNIEEMADTEHNRNPVPFLLVANGTRKRRLRKEGKLADVAPTILDWLGLQKPSLMTGSSLLKP